MDRWKLMQTDGGIFSKPWPGNPDPRMIKQELFDGSTEWVQWRDAESAFELQDTKIQNLELKINEYSKEIKRLRNELLNL